MSNELQVGFYFEMNQGYVIATLDAVLSASFTGWQQLALEPEQRILL
jgi:hypothetical protein